jgi:hypothetical protein
MDQFHFVHLAIAAILAISAWITTGRLKRRMNRALNRNATDSDILSINRWVEVEQAEDKKRGYTKSTTSK